MSGGKNEQGPALDCARIRELGIADEYRAGRLSRDEAEAYEEHYFGCADCFEDLQFGDHLAAYLRDEGKDAVPPEPVEPFEETIERAPRMPRRPESLLPSPPRRRFEPPLPSPRHHGPESHLLPPPHRGPELQLPSPPRRWWQRSAPGPAWAWGLALVVSTVLVVAIVASRAEHEERLRGLIDPLPHPYLTVDLRGGPGGAGFEAAMRLYGGGKYDEAAAGLEEVLAIEPDDPEVAFYLGVSRLLNRQPVPARDALRRASQGDPGSTLYRWYLAQALAACGDLHGALTELDRLIRERSPQTDQAQGLREQIRALL